MSEQNMTQCPIEITLSLLSSKWKTLIIRELLTGTKRFSELKKVMPDVTQKMLTQSLRGLEDDGLIVRKVYPVVPPKVEYSLTELGKTLDPVLDSMRVFGNQYRQVSLRP